MTVEQIAAAFNLLGILVPVVFSLGIVAFHQVAYFRYWTTSYALAFMAVAMLPYSASLGHPLALAALNIAIYLGSAWYSLLTAQHLGAGRSPGRVALGLMYASFVVLVAGLLAGQAYEGVAFPSYLYYIGTQLYLGWCMIRQERVMGAPRHWLGWLVIATGLWVLTYPIAVQLGLVWAGYMISGILHLMLGIGMVIFLLSDVANQLQRRNSELESVERIQADFIRNMSHEFRTPLAAIKNGAWLLSAYETERLTEQQREVLEIIGANVDRFVGLVDAVLDFSKLEARTLTYTFQEQDLRPIIQNALHSLSGLMDQAELTIHCTLPDTPVMAVADRRRIEQVITNLLSNAMKFTPNGGKVAVRARTEGNEAVIEVEDNGIGIAAEDLERVFTKFYQVGDPRARALPGTGLGLSLCRAIVDQHAGKISARPNQGRAGVTFVVRLPSAVAAVVPPLAQPAK